MVIRYAKANPNVKSLTFNPLENAGIDLYCSKNVSFIETVGEKLEWDAIIQNTKKVPIEVTQNFVEIPTGIHLELPKGVHARVAGRSGNAFVKHLIPFEGTIDSSYRGEIKVLMFDFDKELKGFTINEGVAVAQLIFLPYVPIDFSSVELVEVPLEKLNKTERGKKGFGSSGLA